MVLFLRNMHNVVINRIAFLGYNNTTFFGAFCSQNFVRKNLHWLPVRERIHFKIAVITFNALYGNGPEYLKELLNPHKSERSIR